MPPKVLGHPRDLNASVAVYSETAHFVTAKINDLQIPKDTCSTTFYRGGIQGPKSVIKAAVIDARDWEETVSPSGVVSYVSRIGRRALQ